MTYLIAQMLFSLLVAVALGGTIGWWMAAQRRGSLAAWTGGAATPVVPPPLVERSAAAPAPAADGAAARRDAAADLRVAREECATAAALLAAREAELAALREEAERLRAELAARHSDGAGERLGEELNGVRAELATARAHLAAAQRRAAMAEEEGAAAAAGERAAHEQTRRELDELRAVHADCDFAVSALEAQIVALRAAGRTAGRRAQAAPVRASAATRDGAVPEALAVERTRTPDDLKQINGVGPRLERLLNDLGIFYFGQIASLRPQDIAWLDERLEEFRGQIERDEWVAQATDLLAGMPHDKTY